MASKPKGSGFVNLQKYLQANEGAGQKLQGSVRAGLQSDSSGIRSDVQRAGEAFQSGIQKAGERLGEAQQQGQGLIQTAKTAPIQIGDEQVAQSGSLLSLGYTGPKNLEGEADFTRRSESLSKLGELGSDREGRGELLKTYVAPRDNRYTRNLQALDEVFLGQGDPKEQSLGMAETRRESKGLGSMLRSKIGEAKEQAGEKAKGFEQFRQDFGQNIQSAISGEEGVKTGIQNRISELQSTQQQRLDDASKAEREYLDNLNTTYGANINYNPYFSVQEAQNLDLAGVGTEDELASIYALQRLAQDQAAQRIDDTEFVDAQNVVDRGNLQNELMRSDAILTGLENNYGSVPSLITDYKVDHGIGMIYTGEIPARNSVEKRQIIMEAIDDALRQPTYATIGDTSVGRVYLYDLIQRYRNFLGEDPKVALRKAKQANEQVYQKFAGYSNKFGSN